MTQFDTDVERRLDAAIDHAVPDVLAQILSRCDDETTAEIIPITAATTPRRRPSRRFVSVAAAAALIVAMAFGFSGYQAAYAVESVVTLGEGENAVALKLNRKDKVVGVESAEGAASAVDELELEGLDVSDAVSKLTDALSGEGLIDENVTVEGEREEHRDELYTLVTSTVTKAIEKAAEAAAEKGGSAVDALTDGDITGAIGEVGGVVGDVIGEAGGVVGGVIGEAGGIVGDVIGEAGGIVGDVIGGVADGAGDITESAAKGAGDIVDSVTGGLDSILSDISDWLGSK